MFKFPLSNLLAQHIWFHSKRKCQLTLLQPSQGRRPWQNPMLKTNQKKSFFFWNCHKSKWYITCFLDADGYVLKFSNPQNPMTYPYGLIARDLLAMQECHDNHEAGKVHKPRDASTVLWLWGVELCLTENPRIDSWNWAYLRFCTVHHFCISGSTCQRIRRAIRWHCLHSEHKRCEAQINIDSCVQNCPKDKCLETLSPTIDCRMLCRARVTSILWKPRALGFHAHPVQWDHRRCRQRWNWSACTSRLVQCSIEFVAITSLVV